MDYIRIPWFCAFYFTIPIAFVLHTASGTSSLPLENSLELNKDPNHLKTIKTQYGDIYDCVGLYKQPAFDHPLLKHHRIQIRPNIDLQKKVSETNSSLHYSLAFGLKESCPPGTVPIRRTTKEEQMVAKATFTQHVQSSSSTNEDPPLAFAGLSTMPDKNTYILASGLVSTHTPRVDIQQFSSSLISLEQPLDQQFETIRVGWMVTPSLYHGDNRTRLFTLWGQINEGVRHGCFNNYCPGFVQTNRKIPLDMLINPIAGPQGQQLYIYLGLGRDSITGNWWFYFGDDSLNLNTIGYWPSSLFMLMKDGAKRVMWGGMVLSTSQTLPDMGSGEYGDPNGAHFRKLDAHVKSSSASLNKSSDEVTFQPQIVQTNCYKVGGNSFKGRVYWGYSFWFGGKGGDVQRCKS